MSAPVSAAYAAMPPELRPRFAELRDLVFRVAADDVRIGPLDETLKWGEPAYRPRNGVGSTVRLSVPRQAPQCCGVFFICTTRLVDEFRATFSELNCLGNRAILIDPTLPIPLPLASCLHRALGYHLAVRDP